MGKSAVTVPAAPAKVMGDDPGMTPSSAVAALEQRVQQLENVVKEYKSRELTRQIDETNIAVSDFNRKWNLAHSMIEEYVDSRLSVLGGKMDQIEYRRNIWNNLIIPEVDARMGTSMRMRHMESGTPYKQLVLDSGTIDGFFGIVSSLLKFGKG